MNPKTSSAPLNGRVALVAGGSRGIGRACALRLARAGADVVIAARNPTAGEDVVTEIKCIGRRALFATGDLTRYEDVQRIVTLALEGLGGIDLLVVSGGESGAHAALPFVEIEPQTIPDYFSGQLFARLNAIAAVLPHMCNQRYGKIVVITSDAGRIPTPSEALWGAASAALMFSVRAIGREVARFGVRMNAVSITITRGTSSWDRYQSGSTRGDVLAKVFQRIEEATPFGLNSVEDVAEAVAFFMLPGSDQISGATLSVNGGLSFP